MSHNNVVCKHCLSTYRIGSKHSCDPLHYFCESSPYNRQIKFNGHRNTQFAPLTVYADIECIIDSTSREHFPVAIGSVVIAAQGMLVDKEQVKECFKYRAFKGKDCVKEWLHDLEKICIILYSYYKFNFKMVDLTAVEQTSHAHIVNKDFP